jgi:Rrf2 family protein
MTMRLSTKGRYGTRVLLDLALHCNEKSIPLKDIVRKQEIPLPYLEHLIAPLVAGGIIKSIRGSRGGVLLLKHLQESRLSEMIQLLEGSIAPLECINNPKVYPRSDFCAARDI